MLPGETIHSGAPAVCDCGTPFVLEVLRSAAGYYIGTTCRNHECSEAGYPYSRESHYYCTREEAQQDLDSGEIRWRT